MIRVLVAPRVEQADEQKRSLISVTLFCSFFKGVRQEYRIDSSRSGHQEPTEAIYAKSVPVEAGILIINYRN
jgi:hypothetical protein